MTQRFPNSPLSYIPRLTFPNAIWVPKETGSLEKGNHCSWKLIGSSTISSAALNPVKESADLSTTASTRNANGSFVSCVFVQVYAYAYMHMCLHTCVFRCMLCACVECAYVCMCMHVCAVYICVCVCPPEACVVLLLYQLLSTVFF